MPGKSSVVLCSHNFERALFLWTTIMHMYSQTIMLTNIVAVHVTAPGHKELLTIMSDAIWSHLATMNELSLA